jgi:hypothetical protein
VSDPLGPASIMLGSFSQLGDGAPFMGSVRPIIKPTDPPQSLPQEIPFFRSRQFRLWNEEDLQEYNKLNDVLVKWQSRGWCQFTEESEFIPAKENWISWIKYAVNLTIPAEELPQYLGDLDTMRISCSPKES